MSSMRITFVSLWVILALSTAATAIPCSLMNVDPPQGACTPELDANHGTGPMRCTKNLSVECTTDADCDTQTPKAGNCKRWAFIDVGDDGRFDSNVDVPFSWWLFSKDENPAVRDNDCQVDGNGDGDPIDWLIVGRCADTPSLLCDNGAAPCPTGICIEYARYVELRNVDGPPVDCHPFPGRQLKILHTLHGFTIGVDAASLRAPAVDNGDIVELNVGKTLRNYSYQGLHHHRTKGSLIIRAADIILGSDNCPATTPGHDNVSLSADPEVGQAGVVLVATTGSICTGTAIPDTNNEVRLQSPVVASIQMKAAEVIDFFNDGFGEWELNAEASGQIVMKACQVAGSTYPASVTRCANDGLCIGECSTADCSSGLTAASECPDLRCRADWDDSALERRCAQTYCYDNRNRQFTALACTGTPGTTGDCPGGCGSNVTCEWRPCSTNSDCPYGSCPTSCAACASCTGDPECPPGYRCTTDSCAIQDCQNNAP